MEREMLNAMLYVVCGIKWFQRTTIFAHGLVYMLAELGIPGSLYFSILLAPIHVDWVLLNGGSWSYVVMGRNLRVCRLATRDLRRGLTGLALVRHKDEIPMTRRNKNAGRGEEKG